MICRECKTDKPENDFYKEKRRVCKLCYLKAKKAYYQEHKVEKIRKSSEYYYKNKEHCREVNKKWVQENKEQIALWRKEYFQNNKDKISAQARLLRKENIDRYRAYDQKNRDKNRERRQEQDRIRYYKADKEKRNARQRERRKNPQNRIGSNVSRHIRKAIQTLKAGRHWEILVGYTLFELMRYLESQFADGMSWDNYNKWHIDHIRPVSSFNFTKPEDEGFKQCWALSNLQPLWAKDNMSKHDKWIAKVV